MDCPQKKAPLFHDRRRVTVFLPIILSLKTPGAFRRMYIASSIQVL